MQVSKAASAYRVDVFEYLAQPLRALADWPVAPTRGRPPVAPASPTSPATTTAALRARDPRGVRVVPLRPSSPWPQRRGHERLLNPFRSFPFRAVHLARLMYADKAC